MLSLLLWALRCQLSSPQHRHSLLVQWAPLSSPQHRHSLLVLVWL